ncbi:MAG: hypothetical protein ACKVRP_13975 [Bacteroidota bacterium]
MKQLAQGLIAVLGAVLIFSSTMAQQSDFEVKENFETGCKNIKSAIEAAERTITLDSLRDDIDALERRYAPRRIFLDKAIHPQTFASMLQQLRELHTITYDRLIMIESQGTTILEYETRLSLLSNTIDSLTEEQKHLYTELQSMKNATATLRATIKRLTTSIQAKDRLIFALIDSIFLPYDKNLNQVTDTQREIVTRKLLKGNVVTRVYDIAADNVRFLEITQLQGKDFGNLVDQYERFNSKWSGLREKINAVSTVVEVPTPDNTPKGTRTQKKTVAPGAYVDSAMGVWELRLHEKFWAGLQKEFTSKGVSVKPFADPKGFSTSIRAYVDSAMADGRSTGVFVDEVWKESIDKEWREALEKESMLGPEEYANLDRIVSTLGEKKFDSTFIAYIALFLAVVAAIWWFVGRKPKAPRAAA